jgi:hypothetical protein
MNFHRLWTLPSDVVGFEIFSHLSQWDVSRLDAVVTKAGSDSGRLPAATAAFFLALQRTRLHQEARLDRASCALFCKREFYSENICFPSKARANSELLDYLMKYGPKATSATFEGCNNLLQTDVRSIYRALGGNNSALTTVSVNGCSSQVQTLLAEVVRELPMLSGIKVVADHNLDKAWFTSILTAKIVKIELLSSNAMSNELMGIIALSCPLLKAITVGNATTVGDPALQDLAHHCPELESLTLCDCQVTDKGIMAFCERAPMRRLHTLHIEGAELQLSHGLIREVAAALSNLQHFSVGFAYPYQNFRQAEYHKWKQAFQDLARNCPSLHTLRLNWETLKVLVDGAEHLLWRFPVEDLTIDGFLFTSDATFSAFAESVATLLVRSVRRLTTYVPSGEFGDAILGALTRAQCALHAHAPARLLESVTFRGCFALTDAFVVGLVSAHPRLHTVRLEHADLLTNKVLTALATLGDTLRVAALPHSPNLWGLRQLARHCRYLKEVDVSGSPRVRKTSVAALARCANLQTCNVASAEFLRYRVLKKLCVSCQSLQGLKVKEGSLTAAQKRLLQDRHEGARLVITEL